MILLPRGRLWRLSLSDWLFSCIFSWDIRCRNQQQMMMRCFIIASSGFMLLTKCTVVIKLDPNDHSCILIRTIKKYRAKLSLSTLQATPTLALSVISIGWFLKSCFITGMDLRLSHTHTWKIHYILVCESEISNWVLRSFWFLLKLADHVGEVQFWGNLRA